MLFGIPNLADSMAAVKKLVYDEKKYSMEELLYHLKNNFTDERVRLEFINKAPKYGNDNPEVDSLAAEIMDHACDYIGTKPSVFGQGFHPQPFTFLWMVDHGRTTAATPDGRRSGEILAYSMSPMQGRDFCGFTALLNSISSLPTKKAPGTASAIVEVSPCLFNDKNMDYFTDALLTAGQKGLANIQFNTVDAETLKEAQKEPDKYKNLAVRVSGFSQKFCLLDKTMQDHIINRTKHTGF
jgi:formate C-acetyltransferase